MITLTDEYLDYLGDKFNIEGIREKYKITFAYYVELMLGSTWDKWKAERNQS